MSLKGLNTYTDPVLWRYQCMQEFAEVWEGIKGLLVCLALQSDRIPDPSAPDGEQRKDSYKAEPAGAGLGG